MVDTSLEAFKSLDEGEVEAMKDVIWRAACVKPGTSANLAQRTGYSAYATSKRVSDLINDGRLVRGALAFNPSGRRAYILHGVQV